VVSPRITYRLCFAIVLCDLSGEPSMSAYFLSNLSLLERDLNYLYVVVGYKVKWHVQIQNVTTVVTTQ
jgi:hypothetical protein